jgi:hypothetical protein
VSATAYKLLKGRGPDELRPGHQRLVLGHLWLPPERCRALGVRGAAWDDAVQEGNIALMTPAKRYDPRRGVPFAAFARPYVDGAIKTLLCKLGPANEPVKRVRRRAASGERAHPLVSGDVDELSDGSGETDVAHAIDRARATARGMAWVRECLGEIQSETGLHGDALTAILLATIGRDVPVREYACRKAVPRETLRKRIVAGLEYLRAEARGDELEL